MGLNDTPLHFTLDSVVWWPVGSDIDIRMHHSNKYGHFSIINIDCKLGVSYTTVHGPLFWTHMGTIESTAACNYVNIQGVINAKLMRIKIDNNLYLA